jgi:hypothetical protein
MDFRHFFSYRAFMAQSRILPNLHDSLLFRGITDLRNKVECSCFGQSVLLVSRADMTIDIIGRIEAEEIDQLEEEEKGAGGSGSAGYGRIRFIQL